MVHISYQASVSEKASVGPFSALKKLWLLNLKKGVKIFLEMQSITLSFKIVSQMIMLFVRKPII